ncbi:MAG TPA: hypothetical protein VFI91_10005 [Longimicrobiaceae bacterium]|nr:hypothetical protein [Longimicrobiaceae bacterium]
MVVRALRLLLRNDILRLRALLRHPTAGSVLGIAFPALLIIALLWAIGPAALPDVSDARGAVGFGMLLAAVPALFSYTILFRGSDAPFIRRLGLPGRALYWERSCRLGALSGAATAALLLPFLAASSPLARPLLVALSASTVAWATSLLALSGAARSLGRPRQGRRGVLSMGFRDPELAAAAPLVYAPVLPLLAAAVAAGFVGAAPGAQWTRLALPLAISVLSAAAATRLYEAALPRFAPRALEMAFAPPPPADKGDLAVGRGLTALLPRRAVAVWARDAAVGGRRFPWAARLAWPIALIGFFALARWGADPATRTWVLAAGALALVAQGGAVVALGQMERQGPRWVDRALGLGWGSRLTGRWLWGWGLSLWIGVPIAVAWSWLAGAANGWAWLVAGAVTAGIASGVSVGVAGRI